MKNRGLVWNGLSTADIERADKMIKKMTKKVCLECGALLDLKEMVRVYKDDKFDHYQCDECKIVNKKL